MNIHNYIYIYIYNVWNKILDNKNINVVLYEQIIEIFDVMERFLDMSSIQIIQQSYDYDQKWGIRTP